MTEPESPRDEIRDEAPNEPEASSTTLQLGGVGAVLLGLMQFGFAYLVATIGAPPDEAGLGDLLRRGLSSSAVLFVIVGLYLLIGGCAVSLAPAPVARRAWPWVWPAFLVVLLLWFVG